MKRLGLLAALLALVAPAAALAQTVTVTTPNTRNADGQPTPVGRTFIINADGSIGSATVAQGSTSSGQGGTLALCTVVTGDQAYTIGTTQPCNLTPNGRLKVGLSSAGNVEPAAQLTTTLTADLVGCKYRAPVTWSVGFTAAAGCDASGNLMTTTRGGASIATTQVSVGTTATLVAAARPGRQRVGVTVTSATQCAFGPAGVTLATGWPLAAVAYAADTWETAANLYAVCAATATVGVREQF